MFSNTYQSGLVSLFYSCGSNPLSIWDKQVSYKVINQHIRKSGNHLSQSDLNYESFLWLQENRFKWIYITHPEEKHLCEMKMIAFFNNQKKPIIRAPIRIKKSKCSGLVNSSLY